MQPSGAAASLPVPQFLWAVWIRNPRDRWQEQQADYEEEARGPTVQMSLVQIWMNVVWHYSDGI